MEKNSKLHAGHWQRLREKALNNNTSTWSDKEMLELTLQYMFTRGDVNEIASRLLYKFKSYAKVLNASVTELAQVEGIGPVVAEKLVLLPKILNFYNVSNAKSKPETVTCLEQCINLSKQFLANLNQERLYMFCINKIGKVTKEIVLGDGEDCSVNIAINDVLLKATENKAYSVIFAHNHPHGKALPSLEDINFTRKITHLLYLSGIRVLDHLIFNNDLYYSFNNQGLIEQYIEEVKKL